MKPWTLFAVTLLAFARVEAQAPAGGVSARAMYFGGRDHAAAVDGEKKKTATKTSTSPGNPATGAAGTATTAKSNAPKGNAPPPATGRPAVPTLNAGLGPLGLRYAILKQNGPNWVEVPTATRFKSGDRIRLKVQANSDGYLYIVTQGTSGAWQVMFPSRSANAGSNRVRPEEEKLSQFLFEGKPGTEKVFVMLARAPEPDLDRAIYNVATSPESESPKQAPRPPAEGTLMAGNLTVTDPLVSRLRTANTRDLRQEEVNSPDSPERAVYVATSSTGKQARVVVDIKLVHE